MPSPQKARLAGIGGLGWDKKMSYIYTMEKAVINNGMMKSVCKWMDLVKTPFWVR